MIVTEVSRVCPCNQLEQSGVWFCQHRSHFTNEKLRPTQVEEFARGYNSRESLSAQVSRISERVHPALLCLLPKSDCVYAEGYIFNVEIVVIS